MSRHLMLVTTRSTELPAPVGGQSIIYPKSDGLWYSRDENGIETLMSSGISGSGPIASTDLTDSADLARIPITSAPSLVTVGALSGGSIASGFGNIAWGSYTPTLTNSLNLDSSTARVCLYTRVGNNVTVHGLFTVDPTVANTMTTLDLSLPIASDFTLSSDLSGILNTSGNFADDKGGHCVANVTDNRATFTWHPVSSGSTDMYFTFQYQIK